MRTIRGRNGLISVILLPLFVMGPPRSELAHTNAGSLDRKPCDGNDLRVKSLNEATFYFRGYGNRIASFSMYLAKPNGGSLSGGRHARAMVEMASLHTGVILKCGQRAICQNGLREDNHTVQFLSCDYASKDSRRST
jgi:hypothetical protein